MFKKFALDDLKETCRNALQNVNKGQYKKIFD